MADALSHHRLGRVDICSLVVLCEEREHALQDEGGTNRGAGRIGSYKALLKLPLRPKFIISLIKNPIYSIITVDIQLSFDQF